MNSAKFSYFREIIIFYDILRYLALFAPSGTSSRPAAGRGVGRSERRRRAAWGGGGGRAASGRGGGSGEGDEGQAGGRSIGAPPLLSPPGGLFHMCIRGRTYIS